MNMNFQNLFYQLYYEQTCTTCSAQPVGAYLEQNKYKKLIHREQKNWMFVGRIQYYSYELCGMACAHPFQQGAQLKSYKF